MAFTVYPLKFSCTDRLLVVERTSGTAGRSGPAATAEMIREVEQGRGFLLSGRRGCGKTSLLNEVSFHFSSHVDNVVALGPLSLRLVAKDGLDSLGSQLSNWLRNNETRFSLPPYPSHVNSLGSWVPFLKRLINQRNADTLLLLLDDLDSVPPEDRAAILQGIQDSSWAKLATQTVLGCAGNLPEDDYDDYTSDEVVRIKVNKYPAVELLNAMIIALGVVPPPGKKGKGKGGKGGGGKPHAEVAIRDEVEATVYAPQQALPGDQFLVQVFVHHPGQAHALEKTAKRAEPEAEESGAMALPEKIQRGEELTFKLEMDGLEINQPVQSCIWRGRQEVVQFKVTVPKDSQPAKIVALIELRQRGVVIGHHMFSFKIVTEATAVGKEAQPRGQVDIYKLVFVSYNRRDLAVVNSYVATWKLLKQEVFMDTRTLEAGDEWEKLIYQNLDKCDAFFVFWSTAASKSDWVEKEFMYARGRQKGGPNEAPRIYPVRVESPSVCPDPFPELAKLQFEDLFP